MSVLYSDASGKYIGPIASDSAEYRALILLRNADGYPVWEDTGVEKLEAAETEVALSFVIPAVATAGADLATVIGPVAVTGHIALVEYYPNEDYIGAATNYRTFSLVNLTGPVTAATLAGSASTVVLNKGKSNIIPNVSLAATAVVADDSLEFNSVHTGTGLADPGGVVVVQFA